ncbi:MAG: SAM-dependent methyltransferase [Acidobacteria bacterium]|nr:SAM-dependent methyltransferase [Acidobacteriota bacterium]
MLAERLREQIRARGPMPFRDWMEAALYDPQFGYYTRRDRRRWGRAGDYRTSAERSELFAATFARYFAGLYNELGQPERWTIVEGGAADETFAQRMLHVVEERYPPISSATRYLPLEVSSGDFDPLDPGIYFSNELLDAFPVHRLTSEGELYVTVDQSDNFVSSIGPLSSPRLAEFLEQHSISIAPGQTIEVNLAVDDWLTAVAAKLERGFVITVDYGAEAPDLYDAYLRLDGTLRAFSQHQFVDNVLLAPGEYDITSSVNWTQVISTGERLGLEVVEFAQQNKFLLQAGLVEELQLRLQQSDTESEKVGLTNDAKEMILPGGMASSFQVLVQKRA